LLKAMFGMGERGELEESELRLFKDLRTCMPNCKQTNSKIVEELLGPFRQHTNGVSLGMIKITLVPKSGSFVSTPCGNVSWLLVELRTAIPQNELSGPPLYTPCSMSNHIGFAFCRFVALTGGSESSPLLSQLPGLPMIFGCRACSCWRTTGHGRGHLIHLQGACSQVPGTLDF
jgi:hypothetical protein